MFSGLFHGMFQGGLCCPTIKNFLVKIRQNLSMDFWHNTFWEPRTFLSTQFCPSLQKYYILAPSVSNFSPVNALFLSILIILPVRLIMWEVLSSHSLLPHRPLPPQARVWRPNWTLFRFVVDFGVVLRRWPIRASIGLTLCLVKSTAALAASQFGSFRRREDLAVDQRLWWCKGQSGDGYLAVGHFVWCQRNEGLATFQLARCYDLSYVDPSLQGEL